MSKLTIGDVDGNAVFTAVERLKSLYEFDSHSMAVKDPTIAQLFTYVMDGQSPIGDPVEQLYLMMRTYTSQAIGNGCDRSDVVSTRGTNVILGSSLASFIVTSMLIGWCAANTARDAELAASLGLDGDATSDSEPPSTGGF